jgi:hypothetical protein
MVIWGSPIFWADRPEELKNGNWADFEDPWCDARAIVGYTKCWGLQSNSMYIYIYHIELCYIMLYYHIFCLLERIVKAILYYLGTKHCSFSLCLYFIHATCAWDEWMWSLPDSRAPRQKLGETLQPLGSLRLIKYTVLLVQQGGKANVTMKSFRLTYIYICTM